MYRRNAVVACLKQFLHCMHAGLQLETATDWRKQKCPWKTPSMFHPGSQFASVRQKAYKVCNVLLSRSHCMGCIQVCRAHKRYQAIYRPVHIGHVSKIQGCQQKHC